MVFPAANTATRDFTMRNGLPVSIRLLSTEDMPFFAAFREKIGSMDESDERGEQGHMRCTANVPPPIPRSHPRFKDHLTLVTYSRGVSAQDRTLLGAAQLYPCTRTDPPHHAEIVIQVEPGSRDLGLETELMRWLMELARDVEVRTVDTYTAREDGELSTFCRRCGYVPDGSQGSIVSPTVWRVDVANAGDRYSDE